MSAQFKKHISYSGFIFLLLAYRVFSQTEVETGITPKYGIDLSGRFPAWMSIEIMNVALWQFICTFGFFLAGLAAKKISDHIFEKKLIPLFSKTRIDLDNLFLEALSKPAGFIFMLGGIAAAMAVLPLPVEPNVNGFVFGVIKILAAMDFLWFLFRIVDIAVKYLTRLAARTDSKLDEQMVPLLSKAIKISIGAVSCLWIIQLFGYNISSLLAGLGIGGLAVALALQDTLSNFFGSVFIFLDRPFAVGDLVKVGEVEGTVEEIGFRTTRIRTYFATLVSIPNKTVASAVVDNLSKRHKRRVSQTIGVTYETTAEQMEEATAEIKKIIAGEERVDGEVIIVRFTEFGSSSLI